MVSGGLKLIFGHFGSNFWIPALDAPMYGHMGNLYFYVPKYRSSDKLLAPDIFFS